ncbi:hypothetical protein MAPG_03528 [Magnaporthiopsis poae ATCC 64411]|uniref:PD-(D/E)XK nuclease-like domain-containing protein n=1 Tax=Magnaporthiopsis poae (strain ATCC 64411 / 73-15) TaxID=644358 RepID=A0A0C4DU91_MAGP6|nr:hypothetical protein MAPG_03528 [Magnaporthiopsis poae ATCC 64411]
MEDDTRIISWLAALPPTKRKRRDPLTPPETKSDAYAMDTPPSKQSAPAVPLIDDAPGAEVAKVFEAARRCEDREQNEAGWNQAVHFPLLRLALPAGGVIDFEPCTTAGITPEILPLSASSGRKVDYCLIVNKPVDLGQPALEVIGNAPARETPREMIRLLRCTLPGLSINHTDFNALKKFPIAVSIETKKPGQSDEQAKVQVGVWQAAQWKMLHWQQDELLRQMELATASAQAESTSVDHQAGDEAGANAMEQDAEGRAAMPAPHSCIPPLVFLPAVIVVGHQWRIAATTCEERGGPTLLWMGSQIGTTDSMLGIYRIIWCVRRLARYASERYWPWYAENILGLRYEAPKDG